MRLTAEEERRLADHEAYYWWHVAKRNYLRTVAVKFRLLDGPPTGLVLDVGTATGESREIVGPGARMVLLDVAAHAGLRASAEPLKVVGLAEQLPFRSGLFHLTLAADVLEHIRCEGAAAGEIARVTAEGGHVLLSVPAWPFLYSAMDKTLEHFRRYSARRFRRLTAGAGLTVRFATPLFAGLLPFAAVRRIFFPPTRVGPKSNYVEMPAWLNRLCVLWFKAESLWLRLARLPFGTSHCILARKPEPRPAPEPDSKGNSGP